MIPRSAHFLLLIRAVLPVLLWITASTPSMWAATGVGETLDNATEEVKETAAEVGEEAQYQWERFWRSIEPYQLKNRSRDEIAAWVIIGLMVGGLAGAVATMRRSGLGPAVNIFIGLIGAFLGGIVVHLAQWDFGWGPVLIRYEEVTAAFVGALLIIILTRVLLSKWRKNRRSG